MGPIADPRVDVRGLDDLSILDDRQGCPPVIRNTVISFWERFSTTLWLLVLEPSIISSFILSNEESGSAPCRSASSADAVPLHRFWR